jgi:hypothetical protein
MPHIPSTPAIFFQAATFFPAISVEHLGQEESELEAWLALRLTRVVLIGEALPSSTAPPVHFRQFLPGHPAWMLPPA